MVQQQTPVSTSPLHVGRRIVRATGALVIIQAILRAFGLVEKMVLATFFGTGWQADAYNAAKDIAFYIFQFVDQVVMHSFLPVFVQRMREQGEAHAWRLASTTINLLILLLAVVAGIGIFFTPHLLPLFLPNWFADPGAQQADLIALTVQLTRTMLAAVIFMAVSSLTYCLLNSYKEFALPASADLALKAIVLVLAIALAGQWGPIALGVGFVCGGVVKLVVHGIGLGRRVRHYRPTFDLAEPSLKRFALLALPLVVGVCGSIVRQVMDTRFISTLDTGNLSALKYARNLCDTPVLFLAFNFGIAIFPFLADYAAAGNRERLRSMFATATRMMVLIFLPLAIALIAWRFPIIHALFGSAQFDAASAQLTAAPLQIYAAAMLIGALEIVVLQFFFALSDTLKPTIVGLIMVPVHIAVAYVGIFHLEWGAVAIAVAYFISKGCKVTVLFGLFRGKIGGLGLHTLLPLLGKMLIAFIPFAAILYIAPALLPIPAELEGKLAKLLALLPYVVAGGVGMASYVALLHVLRVDDVRLLLERVRGKVTAKSKPRPPAETA